MRYADDFVMGFQYTDDARWKLVDLQERMAKFKLTLHGEKTRLIEFGRLPTLDHARRGRRRLESSRRSPSWDSRITVRRAVWRWQSSRATTQTPYF